MQLVHERIGAGRPVVLVHGITESGDSWRPLIPSLATDHLVLTVDLRGHGASATGDAYDPLTLAADVHDTVLAASLGDEPPLVVGHSLGGVVVSAYAAQFPTRGVVNVDQPLRLAAFKDQLAALEPMLRGSKESFDEAIGAVFAAMAGPLDERQSSRVAALRRADQEVVLAIWGTVFASTPAELDAQVGAIASAIRVPYLSLHGLDPGPEYEAWLTSLVPTATVEVWPDHGHYPHLVDQARFLTRLREFDATT